MNSEAGTELIHRVIEGRGNGEDLENLSGMLKSDGRLLDLYCEEIETCANLEWHFLIEKDFGAVLHRKRELTEDLLFERRRKFRWIGMAVAAAIVFCAGMATYLVNAEPRVSASLTANSEASWKVFGADGKPTARDALEKGSRVELSRGALEISFSNGVDAILEGQASLVVEESKLVRLVEGRMHVRVDGEEGHGFTVETGGLRVKDLGTRFGVLHVDGAPAEVHVMEGMVEVSGWSGSAWNVPMLLRKDQAARVFPEGADKIKRIEARPHEFAGRLPEGFPEMRIPFDSVSSGGLVGVVSSVPDAAARVVQPEGSSPVRVVEGKVGKAFEFNGSGTFIEVNRWFGIGGDEARTVAFWLRMSSGANKTGTLVSWGLPYEDTDGHWNITCHPNPGAGISAIGASPGVGRGKVSSEGLNDGKWHHVATIFDPAKGNDLADALTIYIDGVESETVLRGGGAVNTVRGGSHYIGRSIVAGDTATDRPAFAIDELQVARRAFSASEIRKLIAEAK